MRAKPRILGSWFMIMSADGSVIPEYRQALLLDE